jgi:uncharacterized protein YuzE
MKPLYIRLWWDEKPVHHSVDVDDKGKVIVDVAEDGTILGIEILEYDPEFIEILHDAESIARWTLR